MSKRELIFAAALASLIIPNALASGGHAFHPGAFPKRVAPCKGLNRKENVMKDIEIRMYYRSLRCRRILMRTNLDYVDVNPSADDTILMVHGWPGLWSNWIHQIREFEVSDQPILIANAYSDTRRKSTT